MGGAAKLTFLCRKSLEMQKNMNKFLTDHSFDDESQGGQTSNSNGSLSESDLNTDQKKAEEEKRTEEKRKAEDRRDYYIESNTYKSEKQQLFNHLHYYYERLEKRSQLNNNNKVSNGCMLTSSCVSKQLPQTTQQYTSSMSLFSSYWVSPNKLDIITDTRSSDIYIVPLEMVVMKEDRTFITNLSKQKSPNNIQDGYIHDQKYYCCFVSSLSQPRNKFVRIMLSRFFKRYFDQNSVKIMEEDLKMKQKNMQAIIVFDRDSSNIPKLSSANAIVSAIVFSFETTKPIIYIDYVATHEHYLRGSFATMLMNLSQNCCLANYEKIKLNVSNLTTCINCIKELAIVYSRYGFEMKNLEEMSTEADNYHCVYKHFDAEAWHNMEKDYNHQCMEIMFHNGIVPRWINYLRYELKEAEENLFADDMFTHRDNHFLVRQNLGISNMLENANPDSNNIIRTRQATQSSFVSMDANTQLSQGISYAVNAEYTDNLSKLENEVKYKDLTEPQITVYQSSKSLYHYVGDISHGPHGYIQFGDIYEETFDGYKDDGAMFPEKHTKLTKEVMKELTIRVIPNKSCYIENNEYSYGIWFEFKCRKCHKSCFVRKRAGMHCDEFLIRAIFSKWTTHVFGLELEETDVWNSCNVGWNICKARTKGYYHKLKNAVIFDTTIPLTVRTQMLSYNSQRNHLKILCGLLFSFHRKFVLGTFAYGIEIYEYLKLNKRRSNLNYTQRKRLIARDIGATKSLVKQPKRTKMQTKADINKRHAAEKEWNKTFYADLAIQQNIVKIGFYKPKEILFEELWPDSKEFYNYYTSDKYLKSKNKEKTLNKDLSHFVAITAAEKQSKNSQGKDYVICEDYFLEKNKFGRATGNQRISMTTVDKCKNEPNKLHPLTKADKRLIKQHVNKIRAAGEIQKIRLMQKEGKKNYNSETLLYEGKRHESKIRFEGIDSENRVHHLSEDWIALNFGDQQEDFLNKVMGLTQTGTYIEVPAGNRNSDSTKWPLKKKDIGPPVKYRQKHNKSCIFCSVASAFHEIGERMISQKIMSVYMSRSNLKDFVPTFQELFDILRNQHRNDNEMAIKVKINKQNFSTLNELLMARTDDIYLVILSNRHAIALCKNYIVDPAFGNLLPRTEISFRISAELREEDTTRNVIKKAYGLQCVRKEKNY